MDADKIKEGLGRLNPFDDAHWTQTGKPDVGVLGDMLGDKVTRAEVNEAAPEFDRETARAETDAKKSEGEERTDPDADRQAADAAWAGADGGQSAFDDLKARAAARRAEREGEATEDARLVARGEPVDPTRPSSAAAVLGADDPRARAIEEGRPDRRGQILSREERTRIADSHDRKTREEYARNAAIAKDKGSVEAPDFVSNVTILTEDRRYYDGRFYEPGELIPGFTGRLPIRSKVVSS